MVLDMDIKEIKDTNCEPMTAIEAHKQSMRRFADTFANPPVTIRATCPTCRKVVEAVFEKSGTQILLTFHCSDCPPLSQVHHDALWTDTTSDRPESPTHTYSHCRIKPLIRRLPRTVQTLCPTCAAIVVGRYFVMDGAVLIEKTCPEHGYFRDCVNSDVLLYSKAAWWSFQEHAGVKTPRVTEDNLCPSNCGLCGGHMSGPVLAQLDLTNRCNMKCPVCFANAGVSGHVYQPDFDEIVKQLQALRDLRPHPATAVQFSGGEPTIYPDFLRVVSAARDMGFSHIQIATNGLRIAEADFARQCVQAGLHTIYLQFDGIGVEPNDRARNFPGLWEKKLQAIENCRKCGLKICLVPTMIKGVNDGRVGEIFRFAVDNIDVVSAVSYQPVSFTGRIDTEQLQRRRYTLGDLAHDLADASGASALHDMFPLSIVVPLSQLLQAVTGQPKIRPSCHPDCAFGTYFLVSPAGEVCPFPRVIDVEGMFTEMNRIAAKIQKRGRAVWLDKWRVLRMFKRHFNASAAPEGLTVGRFIRSLQGLVDKDTGRQLNYKTLLCAGMHFQDRYNYDVERSKRCVICYSTPAGMFSFCTYNCGPEYRPIVERAWAEDDRK